MSALAAAVLAGIGVAAVGLLLRQGDRHAMGLGRTPRLGTSAPPWFLDAVVDAAVPVDGSVAWTVLVTGVPLAGTAGLIAASPGIAVAALLVTAGAPALVLRARRGNAGRAVDAALPDALDAIARALRTGAALPQAVGEVVPATSGLLARDLGELVARSSGGAPFVQCLDEWPARCPTPGVRLASAALAMATDAGGAAAEAVDGVAATLRAELGVVSEIRAQSSQARLSALVIGVSPLVFGVFAAGTDPRTARFLLHTSLGAVCVVTALVLDAAAAWWMQRITASPW